MSDLTAWLLERIAEDEAAARACAEAFPPPWDVNDCGHSATVRADAPNFWPVSQIDQEQETPGRWPGEHLEHIARHDPARVLAECASKRQIVGAYEDERQRKDIYNRDYPLGLLTTEGDLRSRLSSNARWAGLDIAARALALPYADHPDYREEWL